MVVDGVIPPPKLVGAEEVVPEVTKVIQPGKVSERIGNGGGDW
jgi:hypothetical protein